MATWNPGQPPDGFSLIETIVAVGIGAVVTLAITSAITNSLNAQRSVETTNEINQFVIEATAALQSPDVCLASLGSPGTTAFSKTTLATANPPSLTVGELKYAGGQRLAKAGEKIPGSNLVTVNRVELTNYRAMGVMGGEARFMADLQITLTKGTAAQKLVGGSSVRPRSIPVLLRMNDTSGTLATCNAFGLSAEQTLIFQQTICTGVNGTWNSTTNTCAPPSAPAPQTLCTQLGGSWGGSSCTLPSGGSASTPTLCPMQTSFSNSAPGCGSNWAAMNDSSSPSFWFQNTFTTTAGQVGSEGAQLSKSWTDGSCAGTYCYSASCSYTLTCKQGKWTQSPCYCTITRSYNGGGT